MPLDASPLPVGRVLAVTAGTQAFATLGALSLAAMAPDVASALGISHALIGYQVALVFFGAMTASTVAGGFVRRFGAVRTSQFSLWTTGAGCALSAAGSVVTLIAGALLLGVGYGLTNPAASQLLSRLPSKKGMNLIFSIKQTGVPIGGFLSGLIVPPLALLWGWQAALIACALLLVTFGILIGTARSAWDTDRQEGAPILSAAKASLALIWTHEPLRWLAIGSLVYSGAQLCLSGFLVTYLVTEVELGLVVAGTILSITHAAGAVGRLAWGWLADHLGSGGRALIINGALTMVGAVATSVISAAWPFWAITLVVAAFGFCAMGWNGVYIALIARQAPAGSVGLATGGSLAMTYAGVVVIPPAFTVLHDKLDFRYGAAFMALALVTGVGIACIVRATRWRR